MNLDPGKSFEARYVLLVDVEADDLLNKIYQILGVKAAKVKIDTADFHGELMEVVFQIDKIIETTDLISVDPHMHTLY